MHKIEKRFISSISCILTIIILLTTASTLIYATEDLNMQKNEVIENNNSKIEKDNDKVENNIKENESKLNIENIASENKKVSEDNEIIQNEKTNVKNDVKDLKFSKSLLNSENSKAPLNNQDNAQEDFKIALKWGGISGDIYKWNAIKSEKKVIKLTFYYQNEVSRKKYLPGELQVTIPGIGKLDRVKTKRAIDIAADEYEEKEQKRDWSYKYDEKTDTYTFFNNKDIEKGSTFNGSFELLWEFDSRECVNDYSQNIQATLNSGDKSVLSPQLKIEFTSKQDTYYIQKTAKEVTSADGLKNFVESGKTVSDYAWVQYTFRYNVQELNARGLKSRYFVDTLPKGCIIAENSNIIKNEDGTISYKVEETSVPENSVKEYSIIVGYPESYFGKKVKNTVFLMGTYLDEKEETKLASSETEIELKKIENTNRRDVTLIGKTMNPSYIYKEDIKKEIEFNARLIATTTISQTSQDEYTIALTDDLLEIYTDKYYRLQDNEYEFTRVTVPGKNNFYNSNGYAISDGNYIVKIKVLYRENANTRGLGEYTTVYEGKWENSEISKSIKNAVAVRVEVSGLTESVTKLYINVNGKINISNSSYQDPTVIKNYDFTDLLDKNGNSLIKAITEADYKEKSIYGLDKEIYGRGLLRASDTISVTEKTEEPEKKGSYYSNTQISPFEIDKQIENFVTKQTHAVKVENIQNKEISKVQIYGVNEKSELKTLIETLKFTYNGLEFKNELSKDTDMEDYLKERAKIQKNGKEVCVTFNFADNPIVSNNFSLGYKIESKVNYENYYDTTESIYTVYTYAFIENSELVPESVSNYKGKKMAYSLDTENILLAMASHQQLIKEIRTEYTNGEFVESGAGVPLNSEYTYRLKLRNGYNVLIDTEFVDILEHGELTKVDEEYPYSKSEWYGKLKNVDTTYIESKGLTAMVYYANTVSPQENDWVLMESYTNGIWQTENEVKAIKVKIEGEILENSIVKIDINMMAPNDESLEDKYTYNTYTINSEAIDLYTGLKSLYLKDLPSNLTEVRLTKKEYNIEISKIDKETRNNLSGVQFGIYNEQGKRIKTGLIGLLGTTTIKNLKEGIYTIKEELVPAGYEKAEDYILTIENGSYTLKQSEEIKAQGKASLEGNIPVIKITIENTKAKGSITVQKIDEYLDANRQEIPLQGVEFNLLDTDGNIIGSGTTNESGSLVFRELEWGKIYVIKETKTLKSYELASSKNTYLSKLDKDKTVIVENKRKTGTVTLTKEDEKTIEKIQGAKYGLYAKEDIYNKNGEVEYQKDHLISEKTTNENGQVTFEKLAWGEYYIKEIETVYGYELSEEKHLFTVNSENVESIIQKTEKEVRSKANLELLKVDDKGKFLQGVEFELFDESNNKIQENFKTDENGSLKIENIEWGNYYIKEKEPLSGYKKIDTKFEFTVNRETFSNGNKVISSVQNSDTKEQISIIKNERKQGKVILTKYSCNASGEETENTLEGAKFELYKSNGELVEEYITDGNGQIVVENLDWDSYYFQEKEAPEGYSISDKKIAFVVNSKNVEFTQELKAYNKLETGKITINKTIKANSLEAVHGNVTFMFKIVGKDESGEEKVTLYKTVTFSDKEKQNADLNGDLTKSIVISDVEAYKYEITEEDNYRYSLDEIIPITNASKEGNKAIINLTGVENIGEVTFKNTKDNNSLLTHAQLITNSPQSSYYLIGISAKAKKESYEIGTKLTGSDFTYTLYYSNGDEQTAELTEGITFNEESSYKEDLVGSYITKMEYTLNGKVFETEVTTKWIMSTDYFKYEVISSNKNTITITGINSKYESPSVLYIPSEYNGYKVKEIIGTGGYWYQSMSNIDNAKSVTIANGVTSIGNYAFSKLSNLTSIEIPSSITSIGDSAFRGCRSLTSINIPEGVTSIGDYAFRECSSLTSINIPEGVTSIGNYVFYYCSKLTSIEIPSSVTSIGNSAFYGCSSLTSINVEEDNQNYCSKDGVLFNKDKTELIRYPSKKADKQYVIPSSVTSIGSSAFQYCSNLTSIEIPSSVTSIGSSAFQYCSSLTSIKIPSGVTSIGSNAFQYCSNLTSIEIPSSVTSIGNFTFHDCRSLTSIEIPSSVTSIGNSAFEGCRSLTSIEIPSSVTSIGNYAFESCSSLTNIEIPSSVTSIGDKAFYKCISLTGINVDENNQNYCSEDGVLFNKDKTKLIQYPSKKTDKQYVIPSSVTSIGNNAFYRCSKLTSIEIPSSVTSIGNQAFEYCSSLTSINIPEGVTNIDEYTFYDCSSLISIEIQSGVRSIGEKAFSGCSSLTSIEISNSITNIGNKAFDWCNKLTTINYHGTEEQFKAIKISSGNDYFKNATVNYIE